MTATKEAPRVRLKFVCVGKTISDDKKPCYILSRVLDNGGRDATERIFTAKSLPLVRVGRVYEIEAPEGKEDGSSIFGSTARFVERWPHEVEAAAWETVASAFDVEQAAKKRAKADADSKIMAECLAPLRKLYLKTNSVGKLAIEVQVLAYLRMVRVADRSEVD